MKNLTSNASLRNAASAIVLSVMLLPAGVWAGSDHGHDAGQMKEQGHMMNHDMREVMGTGRINKVMADKHMVNIVHEPIAELEWPKMRMNFKTAEDVNLSDLKPGQEVTFMLNVKKDNSYVIKQINVKQ